VDEFLFRFTSSSARCLLHDVYETVDEWWDDALDQTCSAVPYSRPTVCDPWPVHGGYLIE